MGPAPAVHSQQSPIPHEERGPHTGQCVCSVCVGGWVGIQWQLRRDKNLVTMTTFTLSYQTTLIFMQEKSPFHDLCHPSLCHVTKDISEMELLLVKSFNTPLGPSLLIQCLRIHSPSAGGNRFDPWSGNQILHATANCSHAEAEDLACLNQAKRSQS